MQDKPEIRPGQSIELLKALHILTRDGRLNQDSRRKLKQVLSPVSIHRAVAAADQAGARQYQTRGLRRGKVLSRLHSV